MNLNNPWEEIDRMRSDMERVFSRFMGRTPWRLAFLPGTGLGTMPRVNIKEKEGGYIVTALAPGVDAQTLEVSVHGTTLSIKGEKKPPEDIAPEEYQRSERSLGTFERTLNLPVQLDGEKTKAAYSEGVLTIELEKAAAAKPRLIEVRQG